MSTKGQRGISYRDTLAKLLTRRWVAENSRSHKCDKGNWDHGEIHFDDKAGQTSC
jgi:hypothetical protein